MPAVVTAVVVGSGAATVAIDVVAVQTAGHAVIWPYRSIAHDLRTTSWDATAVMVVAAAAVAVGLVLLVASLVPGRRKLAAVRSPRPRATFGVGERSIRRSLTRAALDVDGVSRAAVDLGHRRASVTVDSPLRDPGDLLLRVRTAVAGRLDEIALERPPELAVRVRPRRQDPEEGRVLPPGDPGLEQEPASRPGSPAAASTSGQPGSSSEPGAPADRPEPEVGDRSEPAVAGRAGPEVAERAGPETGDRPEPAVADRPEPEVADRSGPAVARRAGPEVGPAESGPPGAPSGSSGRPPRADRSGGAVVR